MLILGLPGVAGLQVSDSPMYNWQEVDWEAFNQGLEYSQQDILGLILLLSEEKFTLGA